MSRTGMCPNCGSVQFIGEVREENKPRFWCLTCGSTVQAAHAEGETAAMPLHTILCVDDDRLVLSICQDALQDQGYRVLTATDGLAGIEIAKQSRPELILLDLLMPGMDGFEVCELLRADPDLREIPIILLTAMNIPDLESKGAEVGASFSMRKPFGPELIVSTVEQVLGQNSSAATA